MPKLSAAFSSAIFAAALALAGGVGCSNGGDSGPKAPADLATFVTPGPAPMCVATCTTHEQCQNSCPAPAFGTSCCDTMTNACFTAQASACPAPPQDFAVSGPY